MYRLALTSMLLLVLSSGAQARTNNSGTNGQHAIIDVHGAFQEQRKAVETELGDGETYSEINLQDRTVVREALVRIASALETSGGFAGLDEAQRASVVKDQELINGILNQAAADSRLICRREKQIGSNRATTQCMTARQRSQQREESRKAMNQAQRNNL
ncbi:hypothetical protein [Pseudoxanthomonas wuyuanensis]